jgi:hypothetical protein
LLRMKSEPRTLTSPNHSLQVWWLNEHLRLVCAMFAGIWNEYQGDRGTKF